MRFVLTSRHVLYFVFFFFIAAMLIPCNIANAAGGAKDMYKCDMCGGRLGVDCCCMQKKSEDQECQEAKAWILEHTKSYSEKDVAKMGCQHAKNVAWIWDWKSQEDLARAAKSAREAADREQKRLDQQADQKARQAKFDADIKAQRARSDAERTEFYARQQQSDHERMTSLTDGKKAMQKSIKAGNAVNKALTGNPLTQIPGTDELGKAIDNVAEQEPHLVGNGKRLVEHIGDESTKMLRGQPSKPAARRQSSSGDYNRPYPFSSNGAWPDYPVSEKDRAEMRESDRNRAAEFEAEAAQEQATVYAQQVAEHEAAVKAQIEHQNIARLSVLDGIFGPIKPPTPSPTPLPTPSASPPPMLKPFIWPDQIPGDPAPENSGPGRKFAKDFNKIMDDLNAAQRPPVHNTGSDLRNGDAAAKAANDADSRGIVNDFDGWLKKLNDPQPTPGTDKPHAPQ